MNHLLNKNKHFVTLMVPIYGTRVYVMDINKPSSCLSGSKIDLKEIDHDTDNALADCQVVSHKKTRSKAVLMRLGKVYSESTLWHECIHCASMVLENCGVDVADSNCEQLAYTTEWIVKMVKQHFYGKSVRFDK